MIRLTRQITAALLIVLVGSTAVTAQTSAEQAATEEGCFTSPSYVAYRTESAIDVDGGLDEAAWLAVPWTRDFVEMATGSQPASEVATRAKVLWDDEALYVGARLEEPDVWATMTDRDSPIYLDNAFEVFIDPDGDSHDYYEFEVNALGTIWDLMLLKPYRDGGPALSAWDIRGLDVDVRVEGTVNDPSDTDRGWSVELAFPWDVIAEAAPEGRRPRQGEQWRFNFSRSHWSLETIEGRYRKRPDTPARWSVWSRQGEIDIHKPECFGTVQFSESPAEAGAAAILEDPNEPVRQALRRLYYRQRAFRAEHGNYAADLQTLGGNEYTSEGISFEPVMRTTQSGYEISTTGERGVTLHIRQDGKSWSTIP